MVPESEQALAILYTAVWKLVGIDIYTSTY